MTPIEGQPGYYVTPSGKIWSDRSDRYIIGSQAGRGYRFIQFPDGKREYIHRIVCRVFHGAAPQGRPEVRHLDGNLANNAAANLAWGSKLENEADKFIHGTTPRGERNPMARLSIKKVEQMRLDRNKTGLSFAKIAAAYGVSTMTAYRAITGVSWQ